jgi:hypothetical protein
MSNNRDEIRPPQSIPATPPACAEARAIAKGEEAVAAYQKDLDAIIAENTPTWKKVLTNLFKGE